MDLAADAVTQLAGEAAPHVILGLLFLITAMLGLFYLAAAEASPVIVVICLLAGLVLLAVHRYCMLRDMARAQRHEPSAA